MKTSKKILGAIGLTMLFFVPAEGSSPLPYLLGWFPAAITLLYLAGMFERQKKTRP